MLTKQILENEVETTMTQSQSAIALLMWGDDFEDFLDSIGVSLETFCVEGPGGWVLGYIDALRLVEVRTVLILISSRIDSPLRFQHTPTGAAISVLPASKSYCAIRRQMVHPYPSLYSNFKDLFGEVRGSRRFLLKMLHPLASYLATPLGLLADELRREGCRAIFCQEYEYSRFDTSVLLGALMRLPVFATFQGGTYDWNPIGGFVRSLTIKACTGLVISPQTEIQRVCDRYKIPPEKIAKIFNPVDLRMWEATDRSEARTMFGVPTGAQVVVWHGRVSIQTKGLDILLDAWEKICSEREGRDMWLLLMGTGRDSEILRQRIADLPIQNVTWINKYVTDRSVLRSFLSSGDVYAFPSRHEGFAVAPIEAMACGLPLVAAAAPGVPDLLEGGEDSGGLMVPREDVGAFAQALSRVLDDQVLRIELGKRARCRIEQYFSLEAVGQQLRDFLLLSTSKFNT